MESGALGMWTTKEALSVLQSGLSQPSVMR